MEKEEREQLIKEMRKIRVDLIICYNHEMQALIGSELQQLLVVLYNEGNKDTKREIQAYCYKKLKERNKLWYQHKDVDYRDIQHLEDCTWL